MASYPNVVGCSVLHRPSLVLYTLAACCLMFSGRAFTQSGEGQIGPGLSPELNYGNDIERAAAAANDLVFRTLDTDCNPNGVLDPFPSPRFSDITGRGSVPGPLCNEDTFFVYLNARELFHTANELQGGQGPTIASLGLDQEGLGLALRWTAAEELAAQGSMATQFANGQLSTLAARLTALRFGVTGFSRTVQLYDSLRRTSPLLAQAGESDDLTRSGAEASNGRFSPWGGFLNYGFGFGSKAPTELEDAFDFDGSEVTFGVDYRLGDLVFGGIFGLSRQDIDFDEAASAISVVDGNMKSDGSSIILFALLQGERLLISGSVGTQSLDYKIDRNIQYPSFNPDVSNVYSIARSEPKADVLTATFGAGFAFNWARFTFEPFLNLEYMDVGIDAFAEQRSIDLLSNTGESRRFDLVVSEQDIESFKTSVGFRLQYVVTPRFGVLIPYGSITAYREHETGSRTITTGYAALADVLGSTTFALPTDGADSSYVTATAGLAVVLRGARQREIGGRVSGGVSGFLQFATVEGRRHFEDQVITAGLRYEF